MGITDLFAGEIATELIKELVKVCRKCSYCKSSAEDLMTSLNQLLPIIHEIRYSGIDLPQYRQSQLSQLNETLEKGVDLARKVLASNRYNVYKNFLYARKMEKLEKTVSRFLNGPLQAHVLADVHHVRVGVDKLEESLGAMRIGMGSGGGNSDGWMSFEEAMRRKAEDEVRERNSVNLVGTGMVLAKKKVKEMILGSEDLGVIGICGMGGSGKTTLATEIGKDPEILRNFNNRVFFETVSQSPNVEQLKQKLWAQIAEISMVDSNYLDPPWSYQHNLEPGGGRGGGGQALVILDDVWSLSELLQLTSSIYGCKILVVSRFKFQTVFNYTYELELLREDEAMSLFCYYAFGDNSVPRFADKKLVEEVVKECKGLPLALKVIGTSLRDQPQMSWIGAKYRLSRGEPMGESHDINLLDRMAISVRYLPEKVRECFLDMASFPEDKKIPLDVLINIWVEIHDIDEEEAFAILTELSDKNLITLVKDSRAADTYGSAFEISITQHDVLRDMALHLSSRDSPTKRRRLLMPRREEALPKEWERNIDNSFQAQILSIHTGEMKEWDWFSMDFPEVEVLILNFSSSEYYLPPFIKGMRKLKALVLINYGNSNAILHNSSVFSSMGNLRSLWLEKIILPSIPFTRIPLRKLRKLSLLLCEFPNSFDGLKLDIDLPLILPHLVDLTMDHCTRVTTLPSSISTIFSLKSLSITNCHDLHDLPTELGNLSSLRVLRLSSCPDLEKLPESLCGMDRLESLDISQCVNLRSLPERIGGLTRLEKINMRECSQIMILPRTVVKLKRLRRVVCDEDASWLWREIEMVLPDLQVEVAEECFNLDWLSE